MRTRSAGTFLDEERAFRAIFFFFSWCLSKEGRETVEVFYSKKVSLDSRGWTNGRLTRGHKLRGMIVRVSMHDMLDLVFSGLDILLGRTV